jgi:alkylation response protein AidB-like acyl-CoA dehydrogenase
VSTAGWSFEPAEGERMVAELARNFARERLAPFAAARDREARFPEAELRKLAELGLLGVNVPEELGGAAAGVVAYSLAMQEIAAADASVAVAMAVTNMVAEVVTKFGTPEQKREHVPRLTGGEYLCGSFALSEPQAGSDPAGMATVARRAGRGWVLTGQKQWITSGDRAGLLVVWAKTDPKAGSRGMSAFLVRGGARGMHVGRHEDKTGLRGSTTVPLMFEDCELPEDALLGGEGDGFKIAMMALDGGRIGIASQAVGIAQAALACAAAYAKERRQFGAPLAQFQAIQWMLADGTTAREAARLLALRAAFRKDRGLPFTREASIAKLYASESAIRICDRAIQVLGGYGYTREFPVERMWRDVRVTAIYEGTSEIQRVVIARELAKGDSRG